MSLRQNESRSEWACPYRPCIEIRAALIVFNFIDGCVIVPIYGNEISSVKTVNGECGRVLKSMYANKCTSEWPCLYDYS